MTLGNVEHIGKRGLYLFATFFFGCWIIIQALTIINRVSGLVFELPINGVLAEMVVFYGASYGIIALWGGLYGIKIAYRWGGENSILGKAIIAFSAGLLAQEFGQVLYTLYIYYLKIENPYPSIGDLGYFGSIIFYFYGLYLLAKLTGIKVNLKTFESKIQAIFLPLVMLCISYWLFLTGYKVDWSEPVKVFLDFLYPLCQAFNISFALLIFLLSRGTLGGIMKNKVRLIIFALLVQYIADFIFLFQSNYNLWTTGGVSEVVYMFAYIIMSLALFNFAGDTLKVVSKE